LKDLTHKIIGEDMNEMMEEAMPTENGLAPMAEKSNDTVSVDKNQLTDYQKQQQIDETAKNAMFDGNGYTKTNGNGKTTESDEIDTTNPTIVDDTKIDQLLPIEKINKKNDLSNSTFAHKPQ